jgi:phage protein D
MMDLEEKSVEHSGMDEAAIAKRILSASAYSQFGLVPEVSSPPVIDVPQIDERTPVQQLSDLEYLKEMARRHGYVFYITPGPTPGQNTAHWGPPQQKGNPQEPLSVNMGPYTNAERLNFRYDGLTPMAVTGSVQDRSSNEVSTLGSSANSQTQTGQGGKELAYVRQRRHREPGLNTAQAKGRIQGMADSSLSKAAIAEGELDAVRYGGLLWPHRPVKVRGAGKSHDGLWNVKSVTHLLRRGEYYRQRFTLGREGMGFTA